MTRYLFLQGGRFAAVVVVWTLFAFARAQGQAPLPVNGIVDQGDYTDSVTLNVPSTAGYSYSVKLDGNPIPTDLNVIVSKMDFHQLLVWRTNLTTLQVTNRLISFVVQQAIYNTTERGIPAWTPYPPINAAAAELAGAQLRILTPQDYPLGLEIPVVAWIEKPAGKAVRANALLKAPGHPSIQLFRGAGSGFLAANNPVGALDYTASIPGIQTNKTINLESSTTWSNVSGTLSGAIDWPANSRIAVIGHVTVSAGATVTIGQGTIVRLNSGVNITNNGHMVINGTETQPVVFTPLSRGQPWGGFLMRTSTGAVDANNTIFVASGAQQSGFPGHKPQQPLFMLDLRPRLALTNCAAIYMAGQFGHATAGTTNASDPNWTIVNIVHSLVQRCITGGEWNGCTLKLLDSAIVEVPFATSTFLDNDEDAIYFTSGEFESRNSVIGWCRDDAMDAGSNDGGSVTVSNNWHESAFHEAFAWSGGGGTPGTRRTTNIHCVAINCGQGYECGWSRGGASFSPDVFVTDCLGVGNAIGARFGDNYTPAEGFTYYGFLRVTNSILLNNIRDVYGYNWQDWAYRASSMDIRSNWLTLPNTNHPSNRTWNSATDGWRLAAFMSTPPDASVGVAFAVWTNQFPMTNIFDGVPVGLSCFTTNPVSVDYTFRNNNGALSSGTLTFAPGETVKRIYPTGFNVADQTQVQVGLSNPLRGELTGETNVTYAGSVPTPRISYAIKQEDVARIGEGIPVTLSGPSSETVTVDYKLEFGGQLLTTGTLTFSPGQTLAWISVPGVDPANYDLLRMTLSNPNWATLANPTNTVLVRTVPLPPLPPATVLVNSNSAWRYLDSGGDAGTAWRQLNYTEVGWSNGVAQIGFGDSPRDETTLIRRIGTNGQVTIAFYFRQTFMVTNPAAFANLSMWLLRDDGGVVYLNGTEAYRSPTMPQLPAVITYQTVATNLSIANAPPDNTVDTTNLNANLLIMGTNIVAVEIHQHDTGSSDISFDFQLIGNPAQPPGSAPTIYWGQFDRTNLVMAWTDPAYVMERATNVTGIYTNPIPASPITASPTNPQSFFRLRK